MYNFISGCGYNHGDGDEADAYIDGWDIGSRVFASYDDVTKKDVVFIELNGGSNGGIYPCGFSFDRNESGFEITSMDDGFISMAKDYFKRNNIALD